MKRKIYETVFLFFWLPAIVLSGCMASSRELVSVNPDHIVPTQTPFAVTDRMPEIPYLSENEKLVDRSGVIQMVLTGNLEFRKDSFVPAEYWSIGEDMEENSVKEGMIFDVLTCAESSESKTKKMAS